MPQESVSRRRFLQNVAAGSTAAAVVSVPGVLDARMGEGERKGPQAHGSRRGPCSDAPAGAPSPPCYGRSHTS